MNVWDTTTKVRAGGSAADGRMENIMTLGEKILDLRKKAGLSQEELANHVCVTRQTVAKWENGQSMPDFCKIKLLGEYFGVGSSYLLRDKLDAESRSGLEAWAEDVDWTNAWSKRYPILAAYPSMEGAEDYYRKVETLYEELKAGMGLSELDAMLVMKDMLYRQYKEKTGTRKKNKKKQ